MTDRPKTRFSDEENERRKQIIAKAIADSSAFARSQGLELTPEQAETLIAKLAPFVAELHATEPTEALDPLVCAAVLEFATSIVDPPLTPEEIVDRGAVLCAKGGNAAVTALLSGGYPEPTETQRTQMVRCIRQRVEALINARVVMEDAERDVIDVAQKAVAVVMGDAPARVRMN